MNIVEINGLKKGKIEEIIKENSLQKGVKVTENLIITTKNYSDKTKNNWQMGKIMLLYCLSTW